MTTLQCQPSNANPSANPPTPTPNTNPTTYFPQLSITPIPDWPISFPTLIPHKIKSVIFSYSFFFWNFFLGFVLSLMGSVSFDPGMKLPDCLKDRLLLTDSSNIVLARFTLLLFLLVLTVLSKLFLCLLWICEVLLYFYGSSPTSLLMSLMEGLTCFCCD